MESTQGNGSLLGGGQLLTCRLDELRPHPSYIRHHLTVSTSQLSALAERGDRAFLEPLVITQERTILDGYAQFELARMQERATLPCIAYELTESEALCLLLERHRRSDGLNAFSRVLLALELEPWLKEKARLNQRAGGRDKGSSKLTEAKSVDVRSEIAAAAGVSLGNVTKVKQIMTSACTELQDALRNGEASIHRAWLWREMSCEKQRRALMLHRGERGVRKTVRRLISKHTSKHPASADGLGLASLARRLSQLQGPQLSSVFVAAVKVPGKAVFVTEELLQLVPAQEELPISCIAESH
jgi:hypothetical protein